MEKYIALMIPIIALLIPIVAILTQHQRRMAEIMRQNHSTGGQDIAELRREVQQLKEIISQQAIQMDDFLGSQKRLAAPPVTPPGGIHERLNS